MSKNPTEEDFVISIDLNKKCSRCGKGGAMKSGICMKCLLVNLKRVPVGKKQEFIKNQNRRP